MPPLRREDVLFQWFEKVNGPVWGDLLDAGTGEHSLGWVGTLGARSVTAVTVEAWRMSGLRDLVPGANVVLGEWTDPTLLYGAAFDQVLVDYVIGAIDGHAPYFQYEFLERIRPHVRDRLYLVGLEPQPRDGSLLDEVCRLRDAAILLAGHRCYREYPRSLVLRWLERAGYTVVDSKEFPNRIGARFINGQLDVAVRKTRLFKDPVLADAMRRNIEALRERALAQGEITWGADYVIAAHT